MALKGIMLDGNHDLFVLNKRLVLANPTMQEVWLILSTNQGELKFNPIIGANLTQLIKSKESRVNIEQRVAVQLQLDGKDYEELKTQIMRL